MMKRMDAGQHPVALGAETVSHEGLWVDNQRLRAIAGLERMSPKMDAA
jgi:hypothetical protein